MCVCPSAAPGDARRVFRVAETSATPFLAAFAHVDGHSGVGNTLQGWWHASNGYGAHVFVSPNAPPVTTPVFMAYSYATELSPPSHPEAPYPLAHAMS